MKNPRRLWAISVLVAVVLSCAPPANCEPFFANYQVLLPDRYDFHTWTWAVSRCIPAADSCVHIQAIPMPVAKAFEYSGDAHIDGPNYTLIVDVPDGLRCGNLYYGPIVATHDVYSWDTTTLRGILTSSPANGCDGAPGSTLSYPFSLVRL